MKRGNVLVKVGIGLLAIVVLGWLFMRTLQDTRSTPYTARAADMRGWTLIVADDPQAGALAGLQPPQAFTADLFKQIFSRHMESLTSPAEPLVPIVTRIEAAAGYQITVVEAARAAGIESASFVPQCVAVRRTDPPASFDYYFVIFEPGPFHAARRAAGNGTAAFDATALIPTLVIATSDPAARAILPFEADPARDCLAPVTLQ